MLSRLKRVGGEQIPSTGDHISIPGYYCSGSVSDSGMGLYRHHMLAAAPATTVYKGRVLKCYKVIVIHLDKGKGIVVEEKVLKPGVFRIHTYPCKFDGGLAVQQALLIKQQRPGLDVYNLVTYNCESFVREAKTGTGCSRQVRRTVGGISQTVIGGPGTILVGVAFGGIAGSAVLPGVGTVVGGVAGGVVGGGVAVVTSLLGVATDCLVERIQEC